MKIVLASLLIQLNVVGVLVWVGFFSLFPLFTATIMLVD